MWKVCGCAALVLALAASLPAGESVSSINYYSPSSYSPPSRSVRRLHDKKKSKKAPVVVSLPVVEVVKQKMCPEGFHMEGSHCVAVEVVPPKSICPHGTDPSPDGTCVAYAPLVEKCPPGYFRSHDGCTKVLTVEPELVCPHGATLMKGKCKSFLEQPPECPEGYHFISHDECAKEVEPKEICPPGYKGHGKKCSRHFAPDPSCPPGAAYDSKKKKCLVAVVDPPRCPAGFDPSPHLDGLCEILVPKIQAPCPHGYNKKHHHDSCERVVKTPPTAVCHEGNLAHDGHHAVCEIHVPQPPSCPHGFSPSGDLNHGGQCVKVASHMAHCPAGFELIRHSHGEASCKMVIKHQAMPSCSHGFELVGDKCKTMESSEADWKCPSGSSFDGAGCGVRRHVAAQLACPHGFHLSEGVHGASKCIREVQEDCSEVTYKLECDTVAEPHYNYDYVAGGKKFAKKGGKKRRILHGKDGKKKAVVIPEPQHEVSCHKVEVVVPKVCSNQEAIAPDRLCPEGSSPAGADCVVLDYTEKIPVCPAGHQMDVHGECIHFLFEQPQMECPFGTEPAGSHKCVEVQEVEAEYNCPAGFEFADAYGHHGSSGNDHCVKIGHPIFPGTKVMTHPAQLVCDVGTLHHSTEVISTGKKGKGHKGGELIAESGPPHCAHVEQVHQPWLCPADSEELDEDAVGIYSVAVGGGKYNKHNKHGGHGPHCVRRVSAIPPHERTEAIHPEYICPDGSDAGKAKKCEEVTDARDVACPKGSSLDHGHGHARCLKLAKCLKNKPKEHKVDADLVCPDGFELDEHDFSGKGKGMKKGPRCITTEFQHPLSVCPPGFHVQQGMGLHRGHGHHGRKIARRLLGDGCVRESPMLSTCPMGMKKSHEGCINKRIAQPIVTVTKADVGYPQPIGYSSGKKGGKGGKKYRRRI